ncbi:MAG TPA: hypothetical protein VIJ92_00055 [Ginsengibacter sp.]
MSIIIKNKTTEELLREVDMLEPLEKESVLAYVRTLNLKRKKRKSIASPEKNTKPLTMAQIDKIKHITRKQYAGK